MSKKEMISSLLKFGINLDLESEEEAYFYIQCFTSWVIKQENFDASMASDSEVEIYYHAEMVMLVIIEDSTLILDPASESCFEAVLLVLRFVSERHEETKKEFKKLNINSIEDEESYSEVISVEEVEDDSEDDSEWI
tara:strand:- start:21 stop:431 length:411 start_codon:yes stop_codon:yes gene_type:complete